MKDFINAAQAGQKMAGAADDAAYQKVKKSYLQAQLDTIAAKNKDDADPNGEHAQTVADTHATAQANNALRAAQARWYAQRQPAGSAAPIDPDPDAAANKARIAAPPALPGNATAPQPYTPAGAVPATPPAPPAAPQVVGQADPAEDAAGIPTQQAASGGPIKRYAAGGAVSGGADPSEEDDDPDDPTTQIAAVGGPAPAAPIRTAPYAAAANDAVAAAQAFEAKHFGTDQVGAIGGSPSYATQRQLRARATGAHAAPLEDMTKLKQAVDPHNQMTDSERNMAATGALYQYKLSKGDGLGAQQVAYQMVQHFRAASDKYAAITANCVSKGDLTTACHAAAKSYANVLDGKNAHFEPTPDGQIKYVFTDANGQVMQQGIEPPAKLAAAAMGMMDGGFDRALNERAGIKNPPLPTGPKPMTPAAKGKALDQINTAYEALNPADPKDATKTKYSPDDQTLHKGAAFRMYNHPNNNMTPDEAAQVATRIADPTIPDKGGFSPKPVDGGVEVTFGKRKTFVPQDDFDALLAKRADALDAKKKAGADDDSKGSWLQGHSIVDGVKGAVGSAVDWTKKDLEKAAKEYPEATARLKSAVGAVGNAASDAKDYIEKEAAKPNIFKGIANGPGEDKI